MLPALGGAIACLRRDGRDVLRPTPEGASDPLDTACFPLVPYANRIARGRFAFDGGRYALPRNFGEHPHSLHGVGWRRPWAVAATDERKAMLVLHHDPDADWPWRFRAEQHVRLSEDGLGVTLLVANDGDGPMPAGLGLHPYFPRHAMTRLTMTTGAMWLGDATMIPTEPVDAAHFGDWSSGAALPDTLIDNPFDRWTGSAAIATGDAITRVTAVGARGVHLYAPPGGDFLCVEPVTHLPDALNRDFDMDVLEPGDTLALAMRIEA